MNSKRKLLIVEDDANLGQILQEYLILKGFSASLCRDGQEGLEEYMRNEYDLCLLDIMMPKKDGFTLASEIKKIKADAPIIFLTAKNLTEDAIHGLKLGADDYVTKPFSMEELILRINAVLKRFRNDSSSEVEVIKFAGVEFDTLKRILVHNGQETRLTSKESELLRLLYQCKNKTLDRNHALKLIWGDDTYFNARSMDVYIAKLRKILKEDKGISILTDHGHGFKLIVDS